MNKKLCRFIKSLHPIVITLFLSLTIFTTCSLEGDILAQRPRPAEIPPPVIPDPFIPAPETPVVIAFDGFLTVKWNAIEEAEIYEVYLNTDQRPPNLPTKTVAVTTAVLDSLINKTTYYIWIKARNGLYSSDYSPRGIGIPWPTNEKPATPSKPIIIPGINQLTVNWEKCGGAVSYEVYINTSPTSPSAPEIITDKTSAVIKNLENDVIYYVWIRAVNNTGKSDYSPLESGTPKIPTVAPATPSSPILIAGSRELTVSWQAVKLASSYEIWAGKSNNSAQAQKQGNDITGDITETVITGLENETTYYVWIKAKNIVGTSGFSLPANAKTSAFAALPLSPATPSISPGSRTLTVTWSAAEGALSYEVWVGVTDNPLNAQKHGGDVSGTSIMLTGLVNETTYYVWVKAKNAIGTSELSPRASGTPSVFAATPPAPQTAPTVIAGSGQLTVNWQTAEGANSYEVWLGTSSNPTIATKRGNDVAGLSSVITGLSNGTTYYIWIKAKNAIGTSNFSPMASGTPSAFTVTPQTPATAPSVSIGDGQITVSWSAVEGTTAYEVWIGTANNSASASKNGTDISASLSKTIDSLSNGTTYYIWIKAKNNIGASGFSPVASGKPIANATTPTLSASNGQLSVTWTTVAGAEQYEVFCGTGINPPQSASQTITGTTTMISGLVNGTTYNVWIRCKNSTGTGAMSGAASGKPIGNMETVALVSGNGQLIANWSAVAGADQYEVYCNTTNSIPASFSQTVSTNTVTIGNLINGTTYYVWIKPKNANGTGSASTVESGKPLGTPGTPTLTPEHNQLLLTWTAVTGADEYEVYYGIGIPTTLAVTTTSTTVTITGLTDGTTYYVRLRAKNASGVTDGPIESGVPQRNPGLYRGDVKIGTQDLTASLTYILSNAVNDDDFYIVLGTNESVSPKSLIFSSGKSVRITLIGYGSERTLTLNTNENMFYIRSGVTLTIDVNITLVGRSTNNSALVYVSGGNLIMNNGAKITGNNANNASGGGIYINSSGTFTMNGGTISGNSAYRGGGIHMETNNGIVIINGGTISGNTASSEGGGGIFVLSGTVIIYNGVISKNKDKGTRGGGGIYISYGNLTIYGGTISGNTTAYSGGGVYASSSNVNFVMYGGIISGNSANSYGGGIWSYSYNGGIFKKIPSNGEQNSGKIYGSDAVGIDAEGIPLKNTSGNNIGHAVYSITNKYRNSTAWETDQIDATTGKGLSSNGNPPFGQ